MPLPAGSGALPAGTEALPAGSEALPAGSEDLPAGLTVAKKKMIQVHTCTTSKRIKLESRG